jgi:hypothetical protein
VPVLLGGIIEFTDLATGFYVAGTLTLALIALCAVFTWREGLFSERG